MVADDAGECRVRLARCGLDPWGLGRGSPRSPRLSGELYIERADPVIYVCEELLDAVREHLHPDMSYGDGILTIRAVNGTVSYGLGPLDLLCLWRRGVRSGPIIDDEEPT